ncbi:UBX domain-containing protein 10 [Amazona aestiva]|uniref:UBX domain-containing protein 10 n=1 Tax=Amazona aestiva TaxID=12930 RepID=A0A0Q3PTH6_AMAAE|nr:UBX domain-containing protein 10 [Amazona aestiva]
MQGSTSGINRTPRKGIPGGNGTLRSNGHSSSANSAPSQLCFPSSTAASSLWSDTTNMHVTRPKSAKGRTRSSFNYSQSTEACPCHVPSSPPPPAPHQLVSSQRALFRKPAFPSSQVSPEEIPELLQHVPLRTSSSLNKYRVLPSIGFKGTGSSTVEAVAEQVDRLEVSGKQEDIPKGKTLSGKQDFASMSLESSHKHCPPEKPGGKMSPSASSLGRLEDLPKEELHLLLAVRSPSGQRFEHHFQPTDSLQTVLAMAEQKTSAKYKHCSVETMDVPRRSFSDLTRSLHECGILHKSVLCIRQKKQHDADL